MSHSTHSAQLNPNQIEWLSRNMAHFGEMYLTAEAVRADSRAYHQGHVAPRNRIGNGTTGSRRFIQISLSSVDQVLPLEPSSIQLPLPLFDRNFNR